MSDDKNDAAKPGTHRPPRRHQTQNPPRRRNDQLHRHVRHGGDPREATTTTKRRLNKPEGGNVFIAYVKDGVKDPQSARSRFHSTAGRDRPAYSCAGVPGPEARVGRSGCGSHLRHTKLVDNEHSIFPIPTSCSSTPIGTGCSRILDGEIKEFHSYQRDIEKWAPSSHLAGINAGASPVHRRRILYMAPRARRAILAQGKIQPEFERLDVVLHRTGIFCVALCGRPRSGTCCSCRPMQPRRGTTARSTRR